MGRQIGHTHFPKGSKVWIRLKSGDDIVGKFLERKGKFVVLECGKYTTREIDRMSYYDNNKTTSY